MGSLSREARFQVRRVERRLQEVEGRRSRLRALAGEAARVLVEEFAAQRVWLFGSINRPWFRTDSDVDLAVEGVAPERLGPAWDRVAEILGCEVDLIALEEADESLRRRILGTGELVARRMP